MTKRRQHMKKITYFLDKVLGLYSIKVDGEVVLECISKEELDAAFDYLIAELRAGKI